MGTYANRNLFVPDSNSRASVSNFSWFYPGTFFSASQSSSSPSQGTHENVEAGPPVTPIHSVVSEMEPANDIDSGSKPAKVRKQKGCNQGTSKALKPKPTKKNVSASKKTKAQIIPETKREKKNPNIDMSNMNFDFSTVPSPYCSCTGVARVCYKWGAGGWQSSCCTINISEYPLPMSSTRPGARMAGRKMSNGAYMKLLLRLAGESYDLTHPVDLKDHWARHGTNKFVTIK